MGSCCVSHTKHTAPPWLNARTSLTRSCAKTPHTIAVATRRRRARSSGSLAASHTARHVFTRRRTCQHQSNARRRRRQTQKRAPRGAWRCEAGLKLETRSGPIAFERDPNDTSSGAIGGERKEGCSCLYGNPCQDQYVCQNWAARFDVAKKNGWKGF